MSFHSGSIFSIAGNYFFNPVQPPIINNYYKVQPPLLFQHLLLLIIITMSNLPYYSNHPIINNYYNVHPAPPFPFHPIIPTSPIIRDWKVLIDIPRSLTELLYHIKLKPILVQKLFNLGPATSKWQFAEFIFMQ